MKYPEEDYIQLSALQHYLFCPRQCALAYLEEDWIENEYTALGRLLHKKVHDDGTEKRKDIIQVRALRLSSVQLGLSGQADVVEFNLHGKEQTGVKLKGRAGNWLPFPVEYKLGKPKEDKSDKVQLCAQAICLEEMLSVPITKGALFYGRSKRRVEVEFTSELRNLTKQTAKKIHDMFTNKHTPRAVYEKKCKSCSLIDICLPERMSKNLNVRSYTQRMIAGSL